MRKHFLKAYKTLFNATTWQAWKAWRNTDEGTKMALIAMI